MKSAAVLTFVAVYLSSVEAQTNPVSKALQLISDLQAKIIKEGEASQKEYAEFSEWCEDRSRNVGFEIRTGTGEVAELQAAIQGAEADSSSLNAKIEDLAASITTDGADLKAATDIREKEAADFHAAQSELVDTISMLERAVGILQREIKKGGAAMAQIKKADNMVNALTIMVDAEMIGTQDATKLTALVQSAQSESEDSSDGEFGAPAATVYAGHSGDIISTLEDLLDKAKDQLDDTRSRENSSKHNFQMLKQSLDDSIKFAEKDLADSKHALGASEESKATATGDLSVTSKALADDKKTLSTLHQDCMAKSEDFEAETKSRGDELKALAAAKQAINDATAGAEKIAYGLDQETSFLEIDASLRSGADLANFEAVRLVRDLARKEHSQSLSQLAMRMASAIRAGNAVGEDPFGKVKTLIKDMIDRLLADGEKEATHKAYCDKEMGETASKKEDKEASIAKLSTKIDSMKSRSAQLKAQVAGLQKALADMAKSQAEMTKLRSEEKALFTKNKAETEQGLEGVKLALRILRDYYASDDQHGAAEGAGDGIISLLEVVESDFTKGLAEMTIAEQTAESEYKKQMEENAISKATKDQDIKYKTKEFKGLDQSIAEATSDRGNVQEELDAVNEYAKKLFDMCTYHPDTYAERTARRAAEIAGLKEALRILANEASLIQKKAVLRGVRRAL